MTIRRFRLPVACLLACVGVALVSDGARAEGFIDVRLGAAMTESGTLEVGSGGTSTRRRVAFDDSFSTGVRGGYWIDPLPWLGLALDASYFNPDEASGVAPLDLHVVPLSALLMLRLPLLGDDVCPNGRIQPYGAIGPGLFLTIAEESSTDFVAASADVGLDVRGGVNIQILRWLAVFAEYRYTRYEAGLDDDVLGIPVDFKVDFDTHHIGGGVGFHF